MMSTDTVSVKELKYVEIADTQVVKIMFKLDSQKIMPGFCYVAKGNC